MAGSSSTPAKRGAAPRIERKIIEKNRRNRMKNLYSSLISLLPHHHSSTPEALPIPEQIDATVSYIKSLRSKLDNIRVKKEALGRAKTASSCITSENQSSCNTPLVDVHSMGEHIDVILAHGLEDFSMFHQIIRVVNQNDGGQILGASFTKHGNSTVQVLHDNKGFGNSTVLSRKLREMICSRTSSSEVVEGYELQISDYEIESNIWGFEITDAGI